MRDEGEQPEAFALMVFQPPVQFRWVFSFSSLCRYRQKSHSAKEKVKGVPKWGWAAQCWGQGGFSNSKALAALSREGEIWSLEIITNWYVTSCSFLSRSSFSLSFLKEIFNGRNKFCNFHLYFLCWEVLKNCSFSCDVPDLMKQNESFAQNCQLISSNYFECLSFRGRRTDGLSRFLSSEGLHESIVLLVCRLEVEGSRN